MIEKLSKIATGRKSNFFDADVKRFSKELLYKISGRRILVIGGAGSIGSATVMAILKYSPKAMHVVDINENNLAELIRVIRNSVEYRSITDFITVPIDFGSEIMHRYIIDNEPFDYILNFAAIKHVRSEKNIHSILHMMNTNFIKVERLLTWLQEKSDVFGFFNVSTDKAALPVNLMGASKRIMEHVIFSDLIVYKPNVKITSARFANVAFSDGSLLYSFTKRFENNQPLSAPSNTKRFFISLEEAGYICILTCFIAPDRHITIPRFDPQDDLIDIETIAKKVIEYKGYTPKVYNNEVNALNNYSSDVLVKKYPLLITELNTIGEKAYEEFVGLNEDVVEINMKTLQAITYNQNHPEIIAFLDKMKSFESNIKIDISKQQVVEMVLNLVPEFKHFNNNNSLDNRM